MNGRRIYWPRGRGLGGSSSINGLIYIRGQPQDYDGWAAAGNRGWGWRDVLPYFIRSEGNQRGASAAARRRRPAQLFGHRRQARTDRGDHRRRRRTRRAAHRRFQRRARRRARATTSCSRRTGCAAVRPSGTCAPRSRAPTSRSKRTRRRRACCSTARARPASNTGRAASLKRATAAREVILAAGSLQSPQLLQLSGIGPAPLLQTVRHSGAARPARRRREPAGPPAAAAHLQVHEADHDQRRPRVDVALREDRPAVAAARGRVRWRSASTRVDCSRARCRSRPGPTSSFISRRCRRTWRAPSRIRFPDSR